MLCALSMAALQCTWTRLVMPRRLPQLGVFGSGYTGPKTLWCRLHQEHHTLENGQQSLMHAFSLFLVVASRARAPCQIMLELTTFQKAACPAHSPLLTGCCVVHRSINQCCTTHHGAACSWRSSLTGENFMCCMWTFHAEPQGLLAAGF